MEPEVPIPIPQRERWREVRITYLPVITFSLVVLAIAWMWIRYVHPPNVVGEVEAVRANIISILPGTLQELKVGLFQKVTNGQELAVFAVTEPDVLQAELAAIEADLKLMKARMGLDIVRNANSYETMRLEILSEKVELAAAQAQLHLAELEFKRAEELFNAQPQKLISAEMYDIAKATRDALLVTVSGRTAFLAEKERTLPTLDPRQHPLDEESITAAIQAQQDRMEQLLKPVVLKSPITGFVSAITNRPGERVTAGRPILVVSGHAADFILGWVRQPVRTKPAVGDAVAVRTSRSGGRVFNAVVTEVGEQLEPISPAALPRNGLMTPGNFVEVGLPFRIKVPEGADLVPGEMVELTVKP